MRRDLTTNLIIDLALMAGFCCFLACARAETRYKQSIDPKGAVTYTPLPAEDVTGDGVINMTDAIAVKAAIPVTTQPVPPVETQPAPGPGTTRTINPSMGWAQYQSILDTALPGDTVIAKGGEYRPSPRGQNFEAAVYVRVSGITFKAATGEQPIFFGKHIDDGNKFIYGVVVGYVKYDGTQSGVNDVVLDGICATEADWDGIEVVKSNNVVIRNCEAYANNYKSPNGWKAGINIEGGSNVTVEHCRVYDNGEGVVAGWDQAGVSNPVGLCGIVIRDNFLFGNSRTANGNNSSGLELWFCDRAIVTGNVIYDNPDANVNGQGNNQCLVYNNVLLNSWQPGGNNVGFKFNVRGGGGNVVANNICSFNGDRGVDDCDGIGNLFVADTTYANGGWGLLTQGRQAMLFNCIIDENSKVDTGNTYPQHDSPGWTLISDWDLWGPGPIKSPANNQLMTLPPNSIHAWVMLDGMQLARTDPRQVNQPEAIWGTSDIAAVREKCFAAYRPMAAKVGASLSTIKAAADANIPNIKTAIDARIAEVASSPDNQMRQATARWKALKASLTGYDLSGLPDNKVMGAAK